MYIAGSLCLWILRAWKIGEIEQIVIEEGETSGEVDVVPMVAHGESSRPHLAKSSIIKRLFQWKRV